MHRGELEYFGRKLHIYAQYYKLVGDALGGVVYLHWISYASKQVCASCLSYMSLEYGCITCSSGICYNCRRVNYETNCRDCTVEHEYSIASEF